MSLKLSKNDSVTLCEPGRYGTATSCDDDVEPGAVDKRGDDLERPEDGNARDDQRARRVIVPRLDQCGEDEHRVAS